MKVIRAQEMGMCFGVRDALQATRQVASPQTVTVHGELVHNPAVIRELNEAGFRQASEDERGLPILTPNVLITAHGISNKERQRLRAEGKNCIDTTCPLVRKVHAAAMELQAEGRHVLLIGKSGHVEVQGIVEDLTSFDVLSSLEHIRRWDYEKLGVLSQSTMPEDFVHSLADAVKAMNPHADIRSIDTVCLPTKQRQSALLGLLEQVEAVVVVGGKNSNNTQRLVRLCEKHAKPAIQVESAEDLNPDWLLQFKTLGLTAGTSTLDPTIDAVEASILALAPSRTAGLVPGHPRETPTHGVL